MLSCSVSPSVRPSILLSITFVYYVKTSNHILKLFHHWVTTFQFFRVSVSNIVAVFQQGPSNGGIKCRGIFSTNILLYLRNYTR